MKQNYQQFKKCMKLRFLPNVSRMQISIQGISAAALMFGLVKKNRDFDITKFKRITRYNLYLNRQYSRLYKYASEGKYVEFQLLADMLMKHSRLYRMAMIHHASSEWYLLSYSKAIRLWNKVGSLIKKESTTLDYSRWWIDKAKGDLSRPLGAPKLEWKIILLMRLQILEILYRANGTIKPWQHAGLSKRGLVTAWSTVLKEVMQKKYIYEFDIKGFFDNIRNQDAIPELPEWNKWFNQVSNCRPRSYPNIDKVPDLESKAKDLLADGSVRQHCWEAFDLNRDLTEVEMFNLINYGHLSDGRRIKSIDTTMHLAEGIPMDQAREVNWREALALHAGCRITKFNVENEKVVSIDVQMTEVEVKPRTLIGQGAAHDWVTGLFKTNFGFPQGANTSPFLSTLVLQRTLGDFEGLLMYMDDGLIYGDTRQEVEGKISKFREGLHKVGLELNFKKSKWVREDDIFHTFKFLGIRADNIISSETRSGTKEVLLGRPVSYEQFNKLCYYFNIPLSDQLKTWFEFYGDNPEGLESGSLSESRAKDWIMKKARDKAKGLEWALERGFFKQVPEQIQALYYANKKHFLSRVIDEAFNPDRTEQSRLGADGVIAKFREIFKRRRSVGLLTATRLLTRHLDDLKLNTLTSYVVRDFLKEIRRKENRMRRRTSSS